MRNRFGNSRRALALLALAGLWAVSAAAADPAAEPGLLRFSGGETITASDLSRYLDQRIDLRGRARDRWGVQKVLREMALARALVWEGERMGEPRLSAEASERFDDAYALAVSKRLSPRCEAPADSAAARRFYEENPQAFMVPPMLRLGRVMLPASAQVEGAAARDWLAAQARAMATASTTFDAVAQRADGVYRLEPQGDLGWVLLTQENAVLRRLAAAQAGELVGPVRDGDFVYLFLVHEKRDGRPLAWDEVAVSAAARALNYCRENTRKKLEDALFAKYGVALDDAEIDRLFGSSRSDE
ncbi:peptidyl-prolyl cis-trans isomerase [Verminephrobacter aporrectodeae subsp. tuberculatae]|uniref:peptidylprolyl isomerase n=1 Tax=Verminephrobacter aporrectodeae TaxID=1110389 RepID=UPI0022431C51|nr:peptidylprolyl isomerase [Verminephrobacter aporrectodeae]MCW8197972.1 peptidyl-prolyl cis-trans isomerase [Verminephrobacter aporrectodeae subsp. tuberculatae]